MTIYNKLKDYYSDIDFEIIHCDERNSSFFDWQKESHITINNMENVEPISLIYKNNVLDIIDIDKLINSLSIIDKHLFTFVNEIVFVIDDSDIEYLDEYYCIDLNDNYLGQYNSENSVIVINLQSILERTYTILEEGSILTEYTMNNFASEEMMITLIHELFHVILDKDETNSLEEVLPFNLNEVQDREMEEIIVERFAKKIVSSSIKRLTLFSSEFMRDYMEKQYVINLDTY